VVPLLNSSLHPDTYFAQALAHLFLSLDKTEIRLPPLRRDEVHRHAKGCQNRHDTQYVMPRENIVAGALPWAWRRYVRRSDALEAPELLGEALRVELRVSPSRCRSSNVGMSRTEVAPFSIATAPVSPGSTPITLMRAARHGDFLNAVAVVVAGFSVRSPQIGVGVAHRLGVRV